MDVWSLACLIWAAWQGESPFHNASDALAVDDIMDYIKHQPTSLARWEWLFSKFGPININDK